MHKNRNNVRENIERYILSNKTDKTSFDDKISMLNELPNATAVETVTTPTDLPDTA